jgi:hypothetical protein
MAAPVTTKTKSATSGASSVASLATAFTTNVVAGRLIVVTAACNPTGGAVFNAGAVTDSQGNTYTRRGGIDGTDNGGIWTTIASASGALTVTVTPSIATKIQMYMYEKSFVGTLTYTADSATQTAIYRRWLCYHRSCVHWLD